MWDNKKSQISFDIFEINTLCIAESILIIRYILNEIDLLVPVFYIDYLLSVLIMYSY